MVPPLSATGFHRRLSQDDWAHQDRSSRLSPHGHFTSHNYTNNYDGSSRPNKSYPSYDPSTYDGSSRPNKSYPSYDPSTYDESSRPNKSYPSYDPSTYDESSRPNKSYPSYDPSTYNGSRRPNKSYPSYDPNTYDDSREPNNFFAFNNPSTYDGSRRPNESCSRYDPSTYNDRRSNDFFAFNNPSTYDGSRKPNESSSYNNCNPSRIRTWSEGEDHHYGDSCLNMKKYSKSPFPTSENQYSPPSRNEDYSSSYYDGYQDPCSSKKRGKWSKRSRARGPKVGLSKGSRRGSVQKSSFGSEDKKSTKVNQWPNPESNSHSSDIDSEFEYDSYYEYVQRTHSYELASENSKQDAISTSKIDKRTKSLTCLICFEVVNRSDIRKHLLFGSVQCLLCPWNTASCKDFSERYQNRYQCSHGKLKWLFSVIEKDIEGDRFKERLRHYLSLTIALKHYAPYSFAYNHFQSILDKTPDKECEKTPVPTDIMSHEKRGVTPVRIKKIPDKECWETWDFTNEIPDEEWEDKQVLTDKIPDKESGETLDLSDIAFGKCEEPPVLSEEISYEEFENTPVLADIITHEKCEEPPVVIDKDLEPKKCHNFVSDQGITGSVNLDGSGRLLSNDSTETVDTEFQNLEDLVTFIQCSQPHVVEDQNANGELHEELFTSDRILFESTSKKYGKKQYLESSSTLQMSRKKKKTSKIISVQNKHKTLIIGAVPEEDKEDINDTKPTEVTVRKKEKKGSEIRDRDILPSFVGDDYVIINSLTDDCPQCYAALDPLQASVCLKNHIFVVKCRDCSLFVCYKYSVTES